MIYILMVQETLIEQRGRGGNKEEGIVVRMKRLKREMNRTMVVKDDVCEKG